MQAGIDTVYTLLASGRLRVFSTCQHGLDELEGYVRKVDPHGFRDEPVKQLDHLAPGSSCFSGENLAAGEEVVGLANHP